MKTCLFAYIYRGIGVRFLALANDISLPCKVQIGSGAHPSSSPMGTGGSFSGVKWPKGEADHLPPSCAKIKNA